MRPLRRTSQPPAPSGSQYSSMLAWAAAGANRPVGLYALILDAVVAMGCLSLVGAGGLPAASSRVGWTAGRADGPWFEGPFGRSWPGEARVAQRQGSHAMSPCV